MEVKSSLQPINLCGRLEVRPIKNICLQEGNLFLMATRYDGNVLQVLGGNRPNYLMNSNHGGVMKTSTNCLSLQYLTLEC